MPYSKVMMFIYYLNTFVCCCIINLHLLLGILLVYRPFLFMLLVSRPFLFRLLVSFNAVGIFQFESFDYSTRAQNVGVNFVGIILQLNAYTRAVIPYLLM